MINYVYHGRRTPDGGATVTVTRGGKVWGALPVRLDLRNHSPDGFNWGYGGSGPAQLALALVAHATGKDRLAQRIYQAYKWHVTARLTDDAWTLCAVEIAESVRLLVHIRKNPPDSPAPAPENPADANGKGADHVS